MNTSYSAVINPIETDTWIDGIIMNTNTEDLFSFSAEKSVKYNISAIYDEIDSLIISLMDIDGNSILIGNYEYKPSPKNIEWTCEFSGTYYVYVQAYGQSGGIYHISVQSINKGISHALDLLKENRNHEALLEFEQQLDLNPDDPEANLYVSVLRLIDIIETPDNRLFSLFNAFNAKVDLLPSSEIVMDASQSTTKLSEIQSYTTENILPVIDASLSNLEKVTNTNSISVLTPTYLGNKSAIRWIEIDSADANIIAGGLLITKSMIIALAAFNLEIEPKYLHNHIIQDPLLPESIENLIIDYPNLLTGKENIQSLFQSALRNWLLGSSKFRIGLEKMSQRKSPQETHMFYVDSIDGARSASRYLVLLDRVFTGLLTVTGGDINGDTIVNYWDLHDLKSLFDR